MEVPGLRVESDLQLLLAYTTATATPDLGCVCELHHNSRQPMILNPLKGFLGLPWGQVLGLPAWQCQRADLGEKQDQLLTGHPGQPDMLSPAASAPSVGRGWGSGGGDQRAQGAPLPGVKGFSYRKLGSPGSRLRWSLTCRRLITKSPWDPCLGEGGSRNSTG